MTTDPSTEALRKQANELSAAMSMRALTPEESERGVNTVLALAARLSQAEEALDLALDELRTVCDFVRGSNASYVFSRVEEAWLAASSAGEPE